MEIDFEPDEWLYVYGSANAARVRHFFSGIVPPNAMVERLPDFRGQPHWRVHTVRTTRALSALAPVATEVTCHA
jgi:hypothetical protein